MKKENSTQVEHIGTHRMNYYFWIRLNMNWPSPSASRSSQSFWRTDHGKWSIPTFLQTRLTLREILFVHSPCFSPTMILRMIIATSNRRLHINTFTKLNWIRITTILYQQKHWRQSHRISRDQCIQFIYLRQWNQTSHFSGGANDVSLRLLYFRRYWLNNERAVLIHMTFRLWIPTPLHNWFLRGNLMGFRGRIKLFFDGCVWCLTKCWLLPRVLNYQFLFIKKDQFNMSVLS